MEEVTAHLSRCTTGEITESAFQQRLDAAVGTPQNKEDGGKDAEKVDKKDHKGLEGNNNDQKEEPRADKESEAEKEKQGDKTNEKDGDSKGEGEEAKKLAEERKKKAHARYMRYYRSIRSAALSF